MKAMIFAAGMGTRLKPLTNSIPKALVKINNTPLIELLINKLKNNGFNEIIINVHHHAEQIIDFLWKNNNFGIRIEVSDESSQLLDTGGGLKKASWFFDDNKAFLIHNVDVLSSIDILELYNCHLRSGSLTTLAVKKRETSRYFLFDEEKRLCGWQDLKNELRTISVEYSEPLTPYAFSGIHVVNPEIFRLIKEEGGFSMTKVYLRLAKEHRIEAYDHSNSSWIDLGTVENLRIAEKNYSSYHI
jgi:NDP-sugar pyrophosphorylase family protein